MWKRSTGRNAKFSDENTCLFVKINFYLRYLEKQSVKNVYLVFIWLFSLRSEILKFSKILKLDNFKSWVKVESMEHWMTQRFRINFRSKKIFCHRAQKSFITEIFRKMDEADFQEIHKFSFSSLNCHFSEKVTKMITKVNFRILILKLIGI